MAKHVNIGTDNNGRPDGTLFVGEDKELIFEVLDSADLPVNMTGWSIKFDVRPKDRSPDADLLFPQIDANVIGTFSAVRASNTQRARVLLTDEDHLPASIWDTVRNGRYSLKRLTGSLETVLIWGDFSPARATQV